VASGDADEGRPDFEPRDALGRLDGARDRLDGAVDIDHHALTEAIRRCQADPDDVHPAARSHLSDEDAHLRRTDVDGDEHSLLSHDSLRSLQGKYPLQPLFACCDSGTLTDSATALEEVAADDRHVLEDPPSEGEESHEIQVDPEAVAEECQARREEGVCVETREEDAGVEVSLQLRAPCTQQRVERGEDSDRGVSRPLDRKVESERETQKHPGDEAEEREQHLTWAEDDLIRA